MKSLLKRGMCVVITALIMCGCGGKVSATKTTPVNSQNANQTKSQAQGDQSAKKDAGFIETPMDLGGREIKFLTTESSKYTYSAEKDKTPNDTLKVIEAIKSIEKDYNCKITFENMKGADIPKNLIAAKASGETYCDIVEFLVSGTYIEQVYDNNLVMPLDEGEVGKIINLSKNPWLPATGFGKLMGHQYGVHFKTENSGDILRGALLFNKDLAKKYDLGDFYDMVKKDQWTFDKFSEILAKVSAQTSGTKTFPLGYAHEGIFTPLLVYANNGTYADNTDKGYVYKALSDNTLEATNYAVDLIKRGYMHPLAGSKNKDVEAAFANGEMVFYFGDYFLLKRFTSGSVPTEYKYGLLPAPRGPKGNGYNSVTYTDCMYQIMNNVKKPEQVAAVLVAMANRTGKKDMLKTELMYTLQDEESADMLNLMYNNVALDYSRVISTARSTMAAANNQLLKFQQTPKEAYESVETTVQSQYDAVRVQK